MSSIGQVNLSMRNFSVFEVGSGRLVDTVYTNETGRPMLLTIYYEGGGASIIVTIDGEAFETHARDSNYTLGFVDAAHCVTLVVPPLSTYSVNRASTWVEVY